MFKRLGSVVRRGTPPWEDAYPDLEDGFRSIHDRSAPFTMTSTERMYALYQAVRYVHGAGIPGDFVECGVWKGGSAMVAALTFLELGERERNFYLYDTYEGMSDPTERDVAVDGLNAHQDWADLKAAQHEVLCANQIDDAKGALASTGYPDARLRFVQGMVEHTIPDVAPEQISILRLDTDWYESTKHELDHLYPRLASGGVLIVDDYGHWQGARDAVDEYFAGIGVVPFLQRTDYTGRLMVKA